VRYFPKAIAPDTIDQHRNLYRQDPQAQERAHTWQPGHRQLLLSALRPQHMPKQIKHLLNVLANIQYGEPCRCLCPAFMHTPQLIQKMTGTTFVDLAPCYAHHRFEVA
jgi:hypothetical protein